MLCRTLATVENTGVLMGFFGYGMDFTCPFCLGGEGAWWWWWWSWETHVLKGWLVGRAKCSRMYKGVWFSMLMHANLAM